MSFEIASKSIKYYGYVWEKIRQQELSKIAQTGHTASKSLFGHSILKVVEEGRRPSSSRFSFIIEHQLCS